MINPLVHKAAITIIEDPEKGARIVAGLDKMTLAIVLAELGEIERDTPTAYPRSKIEAASGLVMLALTTAAPTR